MDKAIQSKVIAVTGGASGIGFEIADIFLIKGAKAVILLDINENRGQEAAKKLISKHGQDKAKFIQCDVRSDVEESTKEIIKEFKTVHVLVNSAGVIDESSAKRTIEINTIALIELSMKFWEHMRKDKGGAGGTIINISSRVGYMVNPHVPFYIASKFAVVGFTRSLGHESNYRKYGVRVVALCPAVTETNLFKDDISWKGLVDKGEYLKYLDGMKGQKPDAVGKAAVEIFEKGDSGTAWLIEGGEVSELK